MGTILQNTGGAINSYLSNLGYYAGLGGYGLTEPAGTPYAPAVTPTSVANGGVPATGNAVGYPSNVNINPAPATNLNLNSTGLGTQSVLRLNTTANKTTSNPFQQQQQQQPSAQDQALSSYNSYLDNELSELPGLQSSLNDQVNNQYTGSQSTINSGLTQTLNNLGDSNNQIDTNKATSLRGLDQSMQNQLKGANTYLGVNGASNSTAASQLAYALGKVGTQARTNVETQANGLYAQVQTQMNNAKSVAQDQLQQLDTWKNSQLDQISQYIGTLKGNIDQTRANYIQSTLQNIDNQVNTYKQAVVSWITNQATSLGQLTSQLQQYGIGPNANITTPTLNGVNTNSANTDMTQYLFGNTTKKDNSENTLY